jgi:hypothetical protein
MAHDIYMINSLPVGISDSRTVVTIIDPRQIWRMTKVKLWHTRHNYYAMRTFSNLFCVVMCGERSFDGLNSCPRKRQMSKQRSPTFVRPGAAFPLEYRLAGSRVINEDSVFKLHGNL